jgi:hypothetical protein
MASHIFIPPPDPAHRTPRLRSPIPSLPPTMAMTIPPSPNVYKIGNLSIVPTIAIDHHYYQIVVKSEPYRQRIQIQWHRRMRKGVDIDIDRDKNMDMGPPEIVYRCVLVQTIRRPTQEEEDVHWSDVAFPWPSSLLCLITYVNFDGSRQALPLSDVNVYLPYTDRFTLRFAMHHLYVTSQPDNDSLTNPMRFPNHIYQFLIPMMFLSRAEKDPLLPLTYTFVENALGGVRVAPYILTHCLVPTTNKDELNALSPDGCAECHKRIPRKNCVYTSCGHEYCIHCYKRLCATDQEYPMMCRQCQNPIFVTKVCKEHPDTTPLCAPEEIRKIYRVFAGLDAP